MRTCIRCKIEKEDKDFTFKRKDVLTNICKDCMNSASSAYRRRVTAIIGRWKIRKGCQSQDCSGHPPHRAALHLAHLEPAMKHHKHSGAIKPWWSKKRIKEELAKCRVLCANCHAIESYEEEHYNLGNIRDGIVKKKL
jgi:hypothetical protein